MALDRRPLGVGPGHPRLSHQMVPARLHLVLAGGIAVLRYFAVVIALHYFAVVIALHYFAVVIALYYFAVVIAVIVLPPMLDHWRRFQ